MTESRLAILLLTLVYKKLLKTSLSSHFLTILILKEYFKISCKIYYKILNYITFINEFNIFNIIKHFKINVYKERKRFNCFSQLEIAFSRVNLI